MNFCTTQRDDDVITRDRESCKKKVKEVVRKAYLVGTLHLAAEYTAIGGVNAQRLADELSKVGRSSIVVHGYIYTHHQAMFTD